MKANRKLIWFILAILALSLFLGYWLFISRNSATPQETDIKVVEVEEVGIKDIQQTIRLIGTIKPKNSTVLIAKTAGILDSLLPAGQVVKKGTLIAKIDNNEIERSYLLSESVEKLAREQYERASLLHKSGHLSKSTVEEKKRLWIEAQKKRSEAKIEFEKIRFQAPFDGTIGLFKAREGAQVQEGDPIVSFYDPASLMVEFGIPASVMTFTHEGQPVRIQGTSYTLTKVQKMIDEETHMSPAYVDFSCENCVIGTGIDVDLTVQRKEKVIVIPFEAVFLRNGKTFVYCVKENKAVLTPVNLGIREKEDVEITSGLQKGDILIARGQARLYPDIAVKIYHQATPSHLPGQK